MFCPIELQIGPRPRFFLDSIVRAHPSTAISGLGMDKQCEKDEAQLAAGLRHETKGNDTHRHSTRSLSILTLSRHEKVQGKEEYCHPFDIERVGCRSVNPVT
jgi:hypothetical protein